MGTYLTLISTINFGLWIMAIVVALLIAAQLCWLLLAFMFEAALLSGVKPIDAPIPPMVRDGGWVAALFVRLMPW